MEVQRCPHCRTQVIPSADGECPSCRRNVKQKPAPRQIAFAGAPLGTSTDTAFYRRQRTLSIAAAVVAQLAALSLSAFVLARHLDGWLVHKAEIEVAWLRCLVVSLLTLASCAIVSYPFVRRSEFVLDCRYGLSKQSSDVWFARYLRRTFGIVVRISAAFTMFYLLLYAVGPYWWPLAAATSSLWELRRSQVRPSFFGPNYNRVEPLDDQDVLQQAAGLLEASGFEVDGVYRVCVSEHTIRPNAVLYGVGSRRSLLVTDTLLEGFTPNEIGVVLAHEVGHIVYRHVPKKLAIQAAWLGCGFFLCDCVLRWWAPGQGMFQYPQIPAHLMPLCFLTFSLWSLLASPLVAGINRHFERQSDRYALDRTHSAVDYKSAIAKLAEFNRVPLNPHPLEVLLWYSHPPPAERIAMAGSDD